MICNSILDALGNTPLIRLARMAPADGAEILVKFERTILPRFWR